MKAEFVKIMSGPAIKITLEAGAEYCAWKWLLMQTEFKILAVINEAGSEENTTALLAPYSSGPK